MGDDRGPDHSGRNLPVFKRSRSITGRRPFWKRKAIPWFAAGGALLALLAFAPLVWPVANPWAERVATVLALFFFATAVGLWLRMGRRAPWVAAAVVVALYALTGWTPLIDVHDLFVLTVIAGLLLFTLAGFNLLFILEEMVYDLHRLLPLRSRWWGIVPVVLAVFIVALAPIADDLVGVSLGTLSVVAPVVTVVLIAGWIVVFSVRSIGSGLMREIHLLVAGAIAGAALADAVALLHRTGGAFPSVLAYVAILGTWMYVTFTTLQRAQYFLRSNDILPWVALLLSACFGALAHIGAQYGVGGERALHDLIDIRVAYLVLGVWIGLAFFVVRGLWRVFQFVRDERGLGDRTRLLAGRLARVAEEVLQTEQRVGKVAYFVFRLLDRILPGPHQPPVEPASFVIEINDDTALEWDLVEEE